MHDSRVWRRIVLICIGLSLSACTSAPPRNTQPLPPPVVMEPPQAPEHVPDKTTESTSKAPAAAPVETAQEPPAPSENFWDALVTRHAFVECDDPPPAVHRFERIYTQSPERHAKALEEAAPWIAFVAEELARRGLPSEFVWLPFVESRYHSFRSSGDRPAGVWQLMPATARWQGLRIDRNYDGRLDFVAATRAALNLLEHLATTFDRDWALVTMAYNAGEYRIRGALEKARKAGKSTRPEKLRVSPITHEHLAKLRALSCIALRPERVGVQLPSIDPAQVMNALSLPKAMPVAQLASLAGVSITQWNIWNPAWRGNVVASGTEILLPRAVIESRGTSILAATATSTTSDMVPATEAEANRTHVVRAGDTAWSIARRYRVPLVQLLSINGLGKAAVLRPGQTLRLP